MLRAFFRPSSDIVPLPQLQQVESVRPARNKFGEAVTQNREGNRVYQLKQEKLRNVVI